MKWTNKDGNKISINKNNADMDKEIPRSLGVSSIILENVIFCHQDEALWPFSEQSNLKKIFDEIFDTSSHTKVLDQLRKDIKKYI